MDPVADATFRRLARAAGEDPDDRFVGGYVDREWDNARHLYDGLYFPVSGASVLELGCNVGASAVVLAHLGARVTAVDVDPRYVAIAQANAERYGVAGSIRFTHIPDTRSMPYVDGAFRCVLCTSILEFVSPDALPDLMREIDRVVAPGGHVVVSGTLNRLYPFVHHSSGGPANWVPRSLDPMLWGKRQIRGVWPWQVTRGFGPGYADVTAGDGGLRILELKRRAGASDRALFATRVANRVLGAVSLHSGYATPHVLFVLQKRGGAASDRSARR